MDKDLYSSEDKRQRIRIIIASTVASIIVLGIAVWAIIAIVTSGNRKTSRTEEPTVAVTEEVNKDAPVEESEETVAEPQETKPSTPAAPSTTPNTPATGSIPSTGPEEIIPFALIAGAFVAFMWSSKLIQDKH